MGQTEQLEMALPTAEHVRVARETRHRRNDAARRRREAYAHARGWCDALGATVVVTPYAGFALYTVKVPGFHPATARSLQDAVAHLEATVLAWCAGPGSRGPTGAALDPLRAKHLRYRAFLDAQEP